MASLYVYSFIAGLFAALGVPHFMKGIAGEQYQGPFGQPVSALFNVVLGWVSFVVAILLLHFSHPWAHMYRASGLFGLAALIMALLLAYAAESSHPASKHGR